jgi:short-subunit dehydrogenase involved in D-alanine esterification of teichoic acids
MIYRSKKDARGIFVLCIGIGVPLAAAIVQFATRSWATGLMLLMLDLCIVSMTFPLTYEITRAALHVRSGMLRWQIEFTDIIAVVPTRNSRSAPAWSRDRLLVAYKKSNKLVPLMISPEDQQKFIQELTGKIPALEFDGKGYARADAMVS